MRNYIKIYRNEIIATQGSGSLSMPCFGIDPEDLDLQNLQEMAAWNANEPGPPPIQWTVTEQFVNYIELDRDIIIAGMTFLFRYIQQVPGQTLPSLLDKSVFEQFSDALVSESPKKTWSHGV